MSTTNKVFTPATVYDHQVFLDVMENRRKQDNVKTEGPKCNRCAYDITWNMDRAQEIWGKRLPFERDFDSVQHVCDKDDQDHYITRQGYVIKEGKAVCVVAGQDPQQKQINKYPKMPSPPLQGISQGPDIYSIEAMVKEQISQLSNHYVAFIDEYRKIIAQQSQEIQSLKAIISEYIAHNPTEGVMKMMIGEMMKWMPEPALTRPTMASDMDRETSSGYTRGEHQN